MKAVFYILFGGLFTYAVSLALGGILFRLLAIRLRRGEEKLLAFVTGSAILSGIVFLLCCTRLARKGAFLVIGIAAIAGAIRMGVHRARGEPLPAIPKRWKWVLGVVFAVFGFLYLSNAMAPEMSPDGAAYHLVWLRYYYRAHGFVRIPWNMYANITQGIELLFLFAYSFGKHSAATLIHFGYLVTLPWLMIAYARRVGITAAGIAGALFVFVSPVVGMDGSSAYVDVALAVILFALFYLLQIWDEERDAKLLIPIGILMGFSFAVKYTALLAVPYVLGFLLWKLRRRGQPWLRPLAAVLGIAAVFIVPWLIKNWIWMQNPVTPFANSLFPNPYIHIAFEEEYRRYQQIYTLTSYKQIPWELTVSGYLLCGLFGPLYLLTPLCFLSLRNRIGRQLVLAGAIFALPYLTNIGTRFLIPCAPFISIALAMALSFRASRESTPNDAVAPAVSPPVHSKQWVKPVFLKEWLLIALVLIHSVASWPNMIELYASQYAWRIVKAPFREALRIIPEDTFLRHNFPGYVYDRIIDEKVPPDGKVFSFGQPAESYVNRQILVKYLSAPNEVLGDIMWTPLYPDLQPGVVVDYNFARRTATKLRIVKTKDMQTESWNASEVHLYDQGNELPRAPQWRLTAKPNPWEIQLAFDNSPVTRWRSWQPARPGMYIEIDFGRAQTVDSVRIELQPDWRDPDMRIDILDESGKWTTVTDKWERHLQPMTVNLRRAASEELKARGIRYLLVGYDDIGSEDLQQHPQFWGIHLLADAGYSRLYYIE